MFLIIWKYRRVARYKAIAFANFLISRNVNLEFNMLSKLFYGIIFCNVSLFKKTLLVMYSFMKHLFKFWVVTKRMTGQRGRQINKNFFFCVLLIIFIYSSFHMCIYFNPIIKFNSLKIESSKYSGISSPNIILVICYYLHYSS